MPNDQSYAGAQTYADGSNEYDTLLFIINQAIRQNATATVAQVKAVTNDGGLAPVGYVDVQPMVHMLDGNSQPTPHGVIYNVPYTRLQGGKNAVIIDPVIGDIGICIFASHDISSVKTNKAPSNPGSRRRFSMADGLYIGGVLNGVPENYIQFDSSGDIVMKPATKVTVLGQFVADKITTSAGVDLDTHPHGGVQTGTGESGPPIPG